MSCFDLTHHVNLRHSATFGNTDLFHKRADYTKPDHGHPWSRLLATCHEHECTYTWRKEVYDRVPVHGTAYVGKAKSEKEAISIWIGYLQSQGVRADDAEVVDDSD